MIPKREEKNYRKSSGIFEGKREGDEDDLESWDALGHLVLTSS
jgi:hypothetical protein